MTDVRAEVLEIYPEINEIADEGLRDATLGVYEKALAAGGWQASDLHRIPFTLLIKGGTNVTFPEHVRTVARMCIAMCDLMSDAYGDRMNLNRDHLIAGAFLADVGKLIEFEEVGGEVVKGHKGDMLRHPFQGVGLCYEEGIPQEVMHIIAVHSKEGDHVARTPEALIFHHADFADFEVLGG